MVHEANIATDLVVGFRIHTIGEKERSILDPFMGKARHFLFSGEVTGYYILLPESGKQRRRLNNESQKV